MYSYNHFLYFKKLYRLIYRRTSTQTVELKEYFNLITAISVESNKAWT